MEYDVIIIGAGPAGYTAAFEAARKGLKTAIIEKDEDKLGGVCLNEGCIPLKGLLHYSGLSNNYEEIKESVFKSVEAIRTALRSRFRNQGIDIIYGEAKFASKHEIQVKDQRIKSRYCVIATGSSSRRFFTHPCVCTYEKIYELDFTPGRVLIIGGGVIGCELASFFHNMGAMVDIVEILDSLIYGEDAEAVRVLEREFRKKKVTVYTKSEIKDINENRSVTVKTEKHEFTETYDLILEATGRKPCVDKLDLRNAGVQVTEHGFIAANSKMQTNISNIYAVGDCIETPMLAYTAYKEAEYAIRNILNESAKVIDYHLMPRIVFSMPQVGSTGLREDEAKEKGINYKIRKYFFKALGIAVVEGKDAGFIKLIVDEDNDRIIGAVVVGEKIVDVLNELTVIINNRIPTEDILECLHIHPSQSEIIVEALKYGGE